MNSLGVPVLSSIAAALSVLVVTLIISYITLVLGELVPKQLGLHKADSVASATARPIAFVAALTRPIVWVLSTSTKLVGRLFGLSADAAAQAQVSEEEIKLMVDEQQGLEEVEKRMITEIFELGDTVVREVMVPRVDIMFAEDTETVREVAERLHARGFSRVPVFHEDHDRIIGILILKDLVVPIAEGKGEECVQTWLHDPVFVPETKDLLSTLSEMQEGRYQMVIVVDEYGGTSGIVTMEDILEEVMGEIVDETDQELLSVREVEPGQWLVEGALDTEDAQELGFPVEESDEFDTLAGWLLEQLGHIPHVGESLEHEGYTFTVVTMRRRRISRIRVTASTPDVPAAPEPEATAVLASA
jgi:putative hemolysin